METRHLQFGDMEVVVYVNMGNGLSIKNNFPDVDGRTFRSGIDFITIEMLEEILKVAKEEEAAFIERMAIYCKKCGAKSTSVDVCPDCKLCLNCKPFHSPCPERFYCD